MTLTLLAYAEAFLLTIFPVLFFTSMVLVRPVRVFSLVPRNTTARALLPLAMTLTFLAFFMRRMADFIAFIALMLRMAFIDLITVFIAAMFATSENKNSK